MINIIIFIVNIIQNIFVRIIGYEINIKKNNFKKNLLIVKLNSLDIIKIIMHYINIYIY